MTPAPGAATAAARQNGGAGGAGVSGAGGGAGAASMITNAASGATNGGALTLTQGASGGAGGASVGGAGGTGGVADSALIFDDLTSATRSASVTGEIYAAGGAGGAASGGGDGGAGAQGYGYLNLTGAAGVQATVVSTGGAGGAGATIGTPGPGQALITAVGTDVTASATAHGGRGASRAGHGKAKTITTGTSGTFTDTANTSLAAGALVTAVSASSTGTVDGKQTGKAKVVLGQTAQPFSPFGQATADASGAPAGTDTAAVLAANPDIATAFGASPVFFAIDELGGQYAKSAGTGPETNTETVNLTVDLTKLASEQDLVVGFYNGTALGAGFTSMTLTITADGSATPLFTQTFTTVASGGDVLHQQRHGPGHAREPARWPATRSTSQRPRSASPPPAQRRWLLRQPHRRRSAGRHRQPQIHPDHGRPRRLGRFDVRIRLRAADEPAPAGGGEAHSDRLTATQGLFGFLPGATNFALDFAI